MDAPSKIEEIIWSALKHNQDAITVLRSLGMAEIHVDRMQPIITQYQDTYLQCDDYFKWLYSSVNKRDFEEDIKKYSSDFQTTLTYLHNQNTTEYMNTLWDSIKPAKDYEDKNLW